MRALAIGVFSALYACDDPDVAARAAEVLEHGSTHAEIVCSGTYSSVACGALPFRFKADLLQDGASFVSARAPWPALQMHQFNMRGDSVSACGFGSSQVCAAVDSGDLVFSSTQLTDCQDPNPITLDAGSYCTGFNLEAFGVD